MNAVNQDLASSLVNAVNQDLASSLVNKPSDSNFTIVILSPATKLALAVRCFPVVSIWVGSNDIVIRIS